MTVAAVEPSELAEAFALLYGPGADLDVGHAFRLVARGELNPGDVLVARRAGAPIGAVFASRLPGGVAVIWPPRAAGDDPALEDALTAAAVEHVAGAKVVQAFLPPEDAGRAGPLLRTGFRHVTRVWQMGLPSAATRQRSASPRRVGDRDPAPRGGHPTRSAGASRLTAIRYTDTDPAAFHTTLVRAHDDSLDCPELHAVLTPDDVLAGYLDVAPDPAGWWLAVADDQPAGVLLLNGDELTFLGVVPEWRDRGVGRQMLELALEQAPGLSLVVDARNAGLWPAAILAGAPGADCFVPLDLPVDGVLAFRIRCP